MPSPPPLPAKSKVVAALLCLIAPGLGHAFVGRTLRGVGWAVLPLIMFGVFIGVSREPTPSGVLKALAVCATIAFGGAIVDVVLMPASKHRPASVAAVVLFVLAPIVAAPMVAILLRVFVIEAFKVPSGAMIPSISVGDHLFADKSVYRKRTPRHGEVVIFKYPEHPEQDFVKRAIALSGDKLEIKSGHPIINGWEVPSCRVGTYRYKGDLPDQNNEGELYVEFLETSAYLVFFDRSALGLEYQGPYSAHPGETWVLGDNRNNSFDSRMWFGGNGGGVPDSNIKGRARLIWLSPEPHRQGSDLAGDPIPPSPELAAPLAACLAKRPSVEAATPPPPR